MSFSSWLRRAKSLAPGGTPRPAGRGPRQARPRPEFVPRVEGLEDRSVPSVFTVTNLNDSGAGSLRQAVAGADAHAGADVIRFAPGLHGTITLTGGQLNVTDDVTINGPGAALVTVSGNNASRAFDVSGSATDVAISDLTVANGRATGTTVTGPLGAATLGGGILNDQAHLLLSHVVLANNRATGFIGGGGGVASISGASLAVEDSFVTNNVAAGTSVDSPGGGILSDASSSLTVLRSFFTGNRAIDGGAIGVLGGSAATVSQSIFVGNVARGNDGTATSDPTPDDNGGALFATHSSVVSSPAASNLAVSYSAFVGNSAIGGAGGPGGDGGQASGGAIGIADSILGVGTTVATISHSTFSNNQAFGGAGGAGGAGAPGGNGGPASGGALSQAGATLTLTDSTFSGNQALGGTGGAGGVGADGGAGGTGRGGAFVHTVAGPDGASFNPLSILKGVTMAGNSAIGGAGGSAGAGGVGGDGGSGQGGAIRALLGTVNVSDSVLRANDAIGGTGAIGGSGGNGLGGALLTALGVTVTATDIVFALNQAIGGAGGIGGDGGSGLGGAIFNAGGSPFGTPTLALVNCLVTLNDADGGAAGAGGSDGAGLGGGVFNLGTFSPDAATVIKHNDASTTGDDVFP